MQIWKLRRRMLGGLLASLTCGFAASHAFAAIPAGERQTLLDLYASGNGEGWLRNDGWGGAAGSECEWSGVVCDAAGEHVRELRLQQNNLTGSLPASLQTLAGLSDLLLYENRLGGSIPPLEGLQNLVNFDAGSNQLSGSIPPLQGLTELQYFHVGGNQLSGAIPSLEGLGKLVYLWVYGNQLDGEIPPLAGLANLAGFWAHENRLSGSIPSLDGLSKLRVFQVKGNRLSGAIPSLAGLVSLRQLDVSWNQLSGAVPEVPETSNLTWWMESGILTRRSALCPNSLTVSENSDWDVATGETPWHRSCIAPAAQVNLNQHGLAGSWAFDQAGAQGFLLDVFPDMIDPGTALLFATWFTYSSTGAQRWYTVEGHAGREDQGASLEIYGYRGGSFDSNQAVERVRLGTARMLVSDCTHASLSYSFDGSESASTIPLTRLLSAGNCRPEGDSGAPGRQLLSGAWADIVANTNQGFLFDVDPTENVFFATWYTFLPGADPDAGFNGQHWYSMQAIPAADFTSIEDIGIFDSTGGLFLQHVVPPPLTEQVGNAAIHFHSCGKATLSYQFFSGPSAGRQGSLELTYLGVPHVDCGL